MGVSVDWGRDKMRLCVWVPTTRMEEPKETGVPWTVMAGSAGLRVVPSIINGVGGYTQCFTVKGYER